MARTLGTTDGPQGGESQEGMHADGGGLYLQVKGDAGRSWIFRYAVSDRDRQMGLGPVSTVSLHEAREKALQCRRLRLEDVDPIEHRKLVRAQALVAAATLMTFDQCAAAYIAANEIGWKNAKHPWQWFATLKTYASPVFGHLPVAAVDTGLVMKVLEPIWATKSETASRLRGRIEAGSRMGQSPGVSRGRQPGDLEGHLDHLLPSSAKVRKVKHHAALPYPEIAGFLLELRKLEGVAPRALEFTILTAARTGETIGATWAEIDKNGCTWTILAGRMKSGRPHRVPLGDSAIAVLEAIPSNGEFVFAGGKGGRAGRSLSNMAMIQILRRMGRSDLTVHGFRSTFRDWASDVAHCPADVAEMALAHAIADETEAAYRRNDMLERRRPLMAAWADYCNGVNGANVVKLALGVTCQDRAAIRIRARWRISWRTKSEGHVGAVTP